MSVHYIFTSGIIVVVLFLIGLVFTFKEFREMNKNPHNYRNNRNDDPEIIHKE